MNGDERRKRAIVKKVLGLSSALESPTGSRALIPILLLKSRTRIAPISRIGTEAPKDFFHADGYKNAGIALAIQTVAFKPPFAPGPE